MTNDRNLGWKIATTSAAVIALLASCGTIKNKLYGQPVEQKPAVVEEADAEVVEEMNNGIASEVNYRFQGHKVVGNIKGKINPLYNELGNWLDNNSSIDPLAAQRECSEGDACDQRTAPKFYDIRDSDNTIHVYSCSLEEACTPDTIIGPRILGITEKDIDSIVSSAGGIENQTFFVEGKDLETSLAEGYSVRDLAVFFNTLNPAYGIDELQKELVNAKEVRGTPNSYCGDGSLADPMAVIEFNQDKGIEYNLTDAQYSAFINYFMGGN